MKKCHHCHQHQSQRIQSFGDILPLWILHRVQHWPVIENRHHRWLSDRIHFKQDPWRSWRPNITERSLVRMSVYSTLRLKRWLSCEPRKHVVFLSAFWDFETDWGGLDIWSVRVWMIRCRPEEMWRWHRKTLRECVKEWRHGSAWFAAWMGSITIQGYVEGLHMGKRLALA